MKKKKTLISNKTQNREEQKHNIVKSLKSEQERIASTPIKN